MPSNDIAAIVRRVADQKDVPERLREPLRRYVETVVRRKWHDGKGASQTTFAWSVAERALRPGSEFHRLTRKHREGTRGATE